MQVGDKVILVLQGDPPRVETIMAISPKRGEIAIETANISPNSTAVSGNRKLRFKGNGYNRNGLKYHSLAVEETGRFSWWRLLRPHWM